MIRACHSSKKSGTPRRPHKKSANNLCHSPSGRAKNERMRGDPFPAAGRRRNRERRAPRGGLTSLRVLDMTLPFFISEAHLGAIGAQRGSV